MDNQQLDSMPDVAFRLHVRSWIESNYPLQTRYPWRRLHWTENRPWYLALSNQGWLAPNWPREHGGMGLGATKQLIMLEEMERFGAARVSDMGLIMLGPLLIKHGSEEQKRHFLPRILSGEDIWCQGYSEPNAGSDLASVRLEALDEGDHWVLNGQKIWITLANDANWIFVLARTNKTGKKQEGISFILVPMDSPGISVRPIINLDMHDEFCEVFFDKVTVPKGNLVGEVNKGWTYAKALLGFERIAIGSPKLSSNGLARLWRLAESVRKSEDPAFIDQFARFRLELADLKALYETFVAALRRGESLGPEISVLKLVQTELFQRITDTMLEIAGENSGLLEPMEEALHPSGQFLLARPSTIFGGSSEILRNIIARNVLNLPA